MRAKSLKRAREDKAWPEIRAAVMERDGGCQLTVRHLAMGMDLRKVHRCEGPLDPHHIVPVARDVRLRLEPDNLVVLCRSAHDWVHTHEEPAKALGLLKSAPLPALPVPEEPK
jgi:5-methylcytosine-specific restriction endonuclease McrA